MSGRTRDATACHPARSIAVSSRTPTRTTRTPIRMHISHIAIAVHRAATAMTPGTGSEPTSITTRVQVAQILPKINAATEPRQSQIVPFYFELHQFVLTRYFSLSKFKSHLVLIKLPEQHPQSTVSVVRRFCIPILTNAVK